MKFKFLAVFVLTAFSAFAQTAPVTAPTPATPTTVVADTPTIPIPVVQSAFTDLPQHFIFIGAGADGNKNWDIDAGFDERIGSSSTYSETLMEAIPSYVSTPTGAKLTFTPVVTTGFEQPILQRDRVTVAISGSVGSTVGSSGFNFTSDEHVSVIYRLNKTLKSDAGDGNYYLVFTPRFVQIQGAATAANTWGFQMNFGHSIN